MNRELEESQYALECAISDLDVTYTMLGSLIGHNDDKLAMESANIVLEPMLSRYNVAIEGNIFKSIFETINNIVKAILNTIMSVINKVIGWVSGATEEASKNPAPATVKDIPKEKQEQPATSKDVDALKPKWSSPTYNDIKDTDGGTSTTIKDILDDVVSNNYRFFVPESGKMGNEYYIDSNKDITAFIDLLFDIKQALFDNIDDINAHLNHMSSTLKDNPTDVGNSDLNVDYAMDQSVHAKYDAIGKTIESSLTSLSNLSEIHNIPNDFDTLADNHGVTTLVNGNVPVVTYDFSNGIMPILTIDSMTLPKELTTPAILMDKDTYNNTSKTVSTLFKELGSLDKALKGLHNRIKKTHATVGKNIEQQMRYADMIASEISKEDLADVKLDIEDRHDLIKRLTKGMLDVTTGFAKGIMIVTKHANGMNGLLNETSTVYNNLNK